MTTTTAHRVYLSGGTGRADEIRGCREALCAQGHIVTAHWLNHDDPDSGGDAVECRRQWLDDVRYSDVLVIFTDGIDDDGRSHVEFGIALGVSARVIVCGPRLNLSHHLPWVEQYATWADVLAQLAQPVGVSA